MGVIHKRVLETRRLAADEPQRVAHKVALVTCAGLGEHPLMAAVDLGELPLGGAVACLPKRIRPGGELLRADRLLLQPVDSAYEPAQQASGAAAEVVVGQRQLVDPLQQHRQAVTGAEQRLEAVARQDQACQFDRRADAQLLISLLEIDLDPGPERRGAGG